MKESLMPYLTTSLRIQAFVIMAVLSISTMWTATAQAEHVRLAIIPDGDSVHPIFPTAVRNFVEKPLRREFSVIPPDTVRHAVQRQHFNHNKLRAARHLVLLGHSLHATHVAVVGISGRGKASSSHVFLIHVATGKVLLDKPVALPHAAVDAVIGKQIAALIGQHLGQAPAVAHTPPPEPPAAPQTGGFVFPGDKHAQAAATPQTQGDTPPTEAHKESAKVEKHPPRPQITDDRPKDAALRRDARIAIGLAMIQRTGHLNAEANNNYEPPCYCAGSGSRNPMFPGFRLAAEIFPIALAAEDDHWYNNFGFTLDLDVAPVKSNVLNTNGTSPSTLHSTNLNLRLAAAYRLMWGNAWYVPDSFIQFGFNYYRFPLGNVAFPGVSYKSPYVGLNFHFPIIPYLAILADASYMFAVSPGDEAATKLGTHKSRQGYSIGGGLRLAWNRYQIDATTRFEPYMIDYSGETNLNNTVVDSSSGGYLQWTDVKLRDKSIKLYVTFGVAF